MDAKTIIKSYQQAKDDRLPYEPEWRESARLALPRQFGGWLSPDASPTSAASARNQLLDTTAARAIPKYVAIVNRIVTPEGYNWHGLEASNSELMKIRAVDLYFEELTKTLFKHRRNPKSRWMVDRQNKYTALGVYGWGATFIGERKATKHDKGGPVYKSTLNRDIFLQLDDDGNLCRVFRRMRPNAYQAEKLFGRDALPKKIRDELAKAVPSTTTRFEICHYVGDRDDYVEGRLDHTGFPILGVYVFVDEPEFIGEQAGYWSWPFAVPMIYSEAENPYGYSPMQIVLSGAKGLQAMKRTVLRQGQKAADPVLLAADDGVLSGRVGLLPGHINFGALDAQGRKRLDALPVGNFQIAKELIQDERNDIDDAFLVNIFRILLEHPEMKAAEVWDRAGKEAMLVAPTMGMLQFGDLGPTIDREIDIIMRNGLGPEMPPELEEAKGEYEVIYTSPLAKMQRIESVNAFFRMAEGAATVAQLTGDTAPLRRFDYDAMIPEASDIMGVPAGWIRSDEMVAEIAAKEEQKQQIDQAAKAAPALAGVLKAANTVGNGIAPK